MVCMVNLERLQLDIRGRVAKNANVVIAGTPGTLQAASPQQSYSCLPLSVTSTETTCGVLPPGRACYLVNRWAFWSNRHVSTSSACYLVWC